MIKFTSKRSISTLDASEFKPNDDDDPKSDVLRVLTSACNCLQYSSVRSRNLRS